MRSLRMRCHSRIEGSLWMMLTSTGISRALERMLHCDESVILSLVIIHSFLVLEMSVQVNEHVVLVRITLISLH